jgi:Zn-dependent peptidase ImmA (M78 family)
MPADISGMIKRDEVHGGPAGFSIIVNKKHPRVRQRFTVAHEIAHFLLHRDKIGNGLKDNALLRSGLSTIEEVQANKLAAKILMPFHLLDVEMKAGTRTVRELAAKFEVSPQAMSIRLGLPE